VDEMKVIIAGGRDVTNYDLLLEAITESEYHISQVICGGASGADALGERWARENGVPVEKCHADWKKYGNAAGPIRNRQMANRGEALIALWDGKSRGTKNMIDEATKKGLKIKVYNVS